MAAVWTGEDELAPVADGPLKVLLVDDQPDALTALEATLSGPGGAGAERGHELISVRSGRDALRVLLREPVALIVLDVVMPDLDGLETAALIREREALRQVPIIFLTGLSPDEVPPARAYELGAIDYIVKPIDPRVLRAKVTAVLDLARRTERVRLRERRLRELERQRHKDEIAQAQARLDAECARARAEAMQREVEGAANRQRWMGAVFGGLPCPLALVEPGTGKVVMANRAAAELAHGTLIGVTTRRPDHELVLTDDDGCPLPPERHPLRRAAAGETLLGEPVGWRLGDGAGYLLVYSQPMPALFGHEPTVLVAFQDVSALKRVEAELREALRAREDFLSVASHELRTPVTAALLQVQAAVRTVERQWADAGAAITTRLRKTEQSVQRLGRLVDALLDLSKMVAGRVDLEPSDVDLAQIVADVTARLQDVGTGAGCAVTCRAEPVVGRWDARRLDQVVTNLVSNAFKYGAGRPVEITVTGDEENATLVVQDAGIGIPAEEHGRIFERFERAQPRPGQPGFGVGLWIVRRVVEEHGGQVSVESRPGEGATFRVVLPRKTGMGHSLVPVPATTARRSLLRSLPRSTT